LGLQNIADPADDSGFGYPQLSAEFILEADPDFIFLADTVCCRQSAATLAERPGWDTLAAVRNGRVIELDDSVASRWGPRIVDFLRIVTTAVYAGTG
jgi:iron complex transport system substrate-binding protein